MLRSTVLYAAGLSVWTSAAVAGAAILRLLAHWDYRDGRDYTTYVFNDVSAVVYLFIAAATFGLGAIVYLATWRAGRGLMRVLLLTGLAPGLLVLSIAVVLISIAFLQARENGALVHPMALLSMLPDILSIAAVDFAVPAALAAAIWSWFFVRR